MNSAYFLTPLLILPIVAIWRVARKQSSTILLVIAFQFSVMASFEILLDCSYVLVTQDSLADNILSERYLFDSFFATAVQYNVFAASLVWLFGRRHASDGEEWFAKNDKRFLLVAVTVAGLLGVYQLHEQGGIILSYGNVGSEGSIEGVAGIWGPVAFFFNLGTLYAVVLLCMERERTWMWRIAYLMSLFLVLMFGLKILTGARAAVFTLALYFVSALLVLRRRVLGYAVFMTIPFALFMIVFASFSSHRITGVRLNVNDAAVLLYGGIAGEIKSSGISRMYGRSIRDLAWRCGGSRMGAVLFADVANNGTVGTISVIDSVLSVIPRMVWKDRPFGNSRDGTAGGMAGYQVSAVLDGAYNVYGQSYSVSSASVAYWMLGWSGVVLSGVVSAWLLWFVSTGVLAKNVNPALVLLGLTGGGWMVITDVGTWLNYLPRYCIYLITIVGCVKLCNLVRWACRRAATPGLTGQ